MNDLDSDLAALGEGVADVLAAECDSRKLHAFVDGKNQLDAVIWKQASELGWLAVGLPEAHGGLGLGVRGLAVLHRELGRRATPGAFISTLSAAQALVDCADNGMKEKFLPRIATGELAVCIPATPLLAGTSTLSMSGGKIRGRATELLGTATAGLALVPVQNESGGEAWALIEVDGKRARLAGHKLWDQTRAFCTLECEGAPAAMLVADAVKAGVLRATLGMHMALAVAFDSVGAAQTILDLTIEYMKTRFQFDKPIASFQGLKHRVASLKIEAELARHAAAQALESVTAGEPDKHLWASLSKVTVSDTFAFIAGDCVQLHGGVGFTWEFDCHLYLKRARLNQALVAPNEKQLDQAGAGLAAATKAGRSTLELAL